MENISFEDFNKLDLRVGEILEAEKIPQNKSSPEVKVFQSQKIV